MERFEGFVGGMELCNAFTELNDPLDQEARFLEMGRDYAAEDEERHPMDEDYLRAMRYGMPPNGGFGMGVDRLTMLLTDSANIREVILFPICARKRWIDRSFSPHQLRGGEIGNELTRRTLPARRTVRDERQVEVKGGCGDSDHCRGSQHSGRVGRRDDRSVDARCAVGMGDSLAIAGRPVAEVPGVGDIRACGERSC